MPADKEVGDGTGMGGSYGTQDGTPKTPSRPATTKESGSRPSKIGPKPV